MQLHHFKLTKAQLDAIPEQERVLLILVAHAADELSVLAKLFQVAAREPAVDVPLLFEARNAQALLLGRLLAGKLYEFWNLLRGAFFATRVSQGYEPLFDEISAAALDGLKQYFGRDNLIATVRNGFAFHYSPDQIGSGYQSLGEGDELDVYLAESHTNTLYVFAETVANRSLMNSIDPRDHLAAFYRFIREIDKVYGWCTDVASGCMMACWERHFGGSLYNLETDIVTIEGAHDLRAVELPYFVELVRGWRMMFARRELRPSSMKLSHLRLRWQP